MKKIILFFALVIFTNTFFAQTFQLKEIRTATDDQGAILEITIEIKEVETGNVFNYGLPKSEWNKTEDEQVQFVIAKYKETKNLEAQEKLNKPAKTEPKVNTQKRNKSYK